MRCWARSVRAGRASSRKVGAFVQYNEITPCDLPYSVDCPNSIVWDKKRTQAIGGLLALIGPEGSACRDGCAACGYPTDPLKNGCNCAMKFAFLIHPITAESDSLLKLDPDGALRRTWGHDL